MKNLILTTMAFALLFTSCNGDDDDLTVTPQGSCDFVDFKYYHGEQVNLGELQNDYILIGIDTIYSNNQIQNFISTIDHFDQNYDYTIHTYEQLKFKRIPLRLNSSKTCEQITQIISELEQNTIIGFVHYTMQTDNCKNAFGEPIGNLCIDSYEDIFYVKVFDENDLTDLNQKITETNTELIGQVAYMPKWFKLRATKDSAGDALKMANYFHETGLFELGDAAISKYPAE